MHGRPPENTEKTETTKIRYSVVSLSSCSFNPVASKRRIIPVLYRLTEHARSVLGGQAWGNFGLL